MDSSGDGSISLREFSAFAKGAACSAQLRNAANSVHDLGGGSGGSGSGCGETSVLASASDNDYLAGSAVRTDPVAAADAGGGLVLTYGAPDHPEQLTSGPRFSDRLALAGGDQGPDGLDAVIGHAHFITFFLTQTPTKSKLTC